MMKENIKNSIEYFRQKLIKRKRAEKERIWKYGKVRDIVYTELNGKKYIAVAGKRYSGTWISFIDFLNYHFQLTFGKKWFNFEKGKIDSEKHQLFCWYDGIKRWQKVAKKDKNGIIEDSPNGIVAAFYCFAYDLYIAAHHQYLEDTLIERLKKKKEFPHARYELFVIATIIRAGFTITFEDEKDRTQSHVELNATYEKTGEQIAIEAKSKDRKGYLGVPGEKISLEKMHVGSIARMINSAIKKETIYPKIIFIDFNLPPEIANRVLGGKSFKKMISIVESTYKDKSGKDDYNAIIMTNHPHHYG